MLHGAISYVSTMQPVQLSIDLRSICNLNLRTSSLGNQFRIEASDKILDSKNPLISLTYWDNKNTVIGKAPVSIEEPYEWSVSTLSNCSVNALDLNANVKSHSQNASHVRFCINREKGVLEIKSSGITDMISALVMDSVEGDHKSHCMFDCDSIQRVVKCFSYSTNVTVKFVNDLKSILFMYNTQLGPVEFIVLASEHTKPNHAVPSKPMVFVCKTCSAPLKDHERIDCTSCTQTRKISRGIRRHLKRKPLSSLSPCYGCKCPSSEKLCEVCKPLYKKCTKCERLCKGAVCNRCSEDCLNCGRRTDSEKGLCEDCN